MGNDSYRHYDEIILTTVAYVQTYPAWQLSLQEACQGQADEIVWSLNASGAGFTRFWGTASSGAQACVDGYGPYGNAVLNIGVPLPGYGGARYQILSPHAPPAEDRNVICGGMQNIGFRYEGCSTHITSYADNYAILQTGSAWNSVGSFAATDGAWSVAAGDFNMAYNGSVSNMPSTFQNWFFTHAEAWIPYSRSTYRSGTMIDYLWADRRSMQQWGRYGCTWYSYSDHGLCPAVFLL